MGLNTTVADLLDDEFPHEVASALAAHELPSSALVLEVTESSVLTDPDRIGDVLARLSEIGVEQTLDDFGPGYSSLSHLRALPVSEVKIDRSFVSRLCQEPADAAIVYATIELAHNLGLRAVAEGVEDELTWDALVKLGCDRIQGYRLGRPVPAAEFDQLLEGPAPAWSQRHSAAA